MNITIFVEERDMHHSWWPVFEITGILAVIGWFLFKIGQWSERSRLNKKYEYKLPDYMTYTTHTEHPMPESGKPEKRENTAISLVVDNTRKVPQIREKA